MQRLGVDGVGGGNGIVSWRPIQDILRNTEADVLLLLDACHSEAAVRAQFSATKVITSKTALALAP